MCSGLLSAMLQLIAARTNILDVSGNKYRISARYDASARFAVRQYLGAYGFGTVRLRRLLERKSPLGSHVDLREHAAAYSLVHPLNVVMVADLISQLELSNVLDIGCGAGSMLIDLGNRDPQFLGWGLDSNRWMCSAARAAVRSAHLKERIRIFEGDCRQLAECLPRSIRGSVRTITASSVANEFFRSGTKAIVEWLLSVKEMFPGRVLVLADYYGQLGTTKRSSQRELCLQDFVQVASGQGVPPSSLAVWRGIYRAAKCTLIHVVEDRDATSFIHILRL